MTDGPTDDLAERLEDLEVKLAFQDKLIKELDALVRTFGDRLDKTNRELEALKQSVRSPETPVGPANEPPPHY
jgi:SlyX protein